MITIAATPIAMHTAITSQLAVRVGFNDVPASNGSLCGATDIGADG